MSAPLAKKQAASRKESIAGHVVIQDGVEWVRVTTPWALGVLILLRPEFAGGFTIRPGVVHESDVVQYTAGLLDRLRGLDREPPHPPRTFARSAWLRGWHDADAEARR